MSSVREQLTGMFAKVMAGTVTREEGAMLINHLAREDRDATIRALAFLIDTPPSNVYQKTILHSIALARNRAFFPLMVSCLDHKNEEVSIFAADELARLHSEESRAVLVEHLSSEVYHVRKASAIALSMGFGKSGVEKLKAHILSSREPFYRVTSAYGLLKAGRPGVEALMDILASGNPGATETAAEVLGSADGAMSDADPRRVVDALMRAGDRGDSDMIVSLLKALGSFGSAARRFEGFIKAFSDSPSGMVREEAEKALGRLGGHRG